MKKKFLPPHFDKRRNNKKKTKLKRIEKKGHKEKYLYDKKLCDVKAV